MSGNTKETNLIASNGEPITLPDDTKLKTGYMTPSYLTTTQYILILPLKAVPFDCHTVKIAFFASDVTNNTKNVDKILYDSTSLQATSHDPSGALWFRFTTDAQFGTDPTTTYEAHFYKNNLEPENFIGKAIGIKNI